MPKIHQLCRQDQLTEWLLKSEQKILTEMKMTPANIIQPVGEKGHLMVGQGSVSDTMVSISFRVHSEHSQQS